jgi:hypothetical protein
MIRNDEKIRVWVEAVVSSFKILFRNSRGEEKDTQQTSFTVDIEITVASLLKR